MGHFPPSENKCPARIRGGGGGGVRVEVMSRLGIDRTINFLGKGGGGGWGISCLLSVYLLDGLHYSA